MNVSDLGRTRDSLIMDRGSGLAGLGILLRVLNSPVIAVDLIQLSVIIPTIVFLNISGSAAR